MIQFQKMHGLGNDFMVINATTKPFNIKKTDILHLANRHVGIGFDQLLIIESSNQGDFFCRIFNSDGSEAEQCGNGLRCIARFLHEEGLHPHKEIRIETKAGVFPIAIEDYDRIRVTLNAPEIQDNLIELKLKNNSESVFASILTLGNPHAIIKVSSIETVLAEKLGPEIAGHTLFPQGANVGFMQIVSPNHIRLRTYERGAGETYACGSNACAAICAGIANGWLQDQVQVDFKFGSLWIEWDKKTAQIHMTGPAANVFSGNITI